MVSGFLYISRSKTTLHSPLASTSCVLNINPGNAMQCITLSHSNKAMCRVRSVCNIKSSAFVYSSRAQDSLLAERSSRAFLRFSPQLVFTAANTFSCCCFLASAAPFVHILTNNVEQSYFLASFVTLHCIGSESLNCRISEICASVRWYFFSYGCLTGSGKVLELAVGGWKSRRGSLDGKNMLGV